MTQSADTKTTPVPQETHQGTGWQIEVVTIDGAEVPDISYCRKHVDALLEGGDLPENSPFAQGVEYDAMDPNELKDIDLVLQRGLIPVIGTMMTSGEEIRTMSTDSFDSYVKCALPGIDNTQYREELVAAAASNAKKKLIDSGVTEHTLISSETTAEKLGQHLQTVADKSDEMEGAELNRLVRVYKRCRAVETAINRIAKKKRSTPPTRQS